MLSITELNKIRAKKQSEALKTIRDNKGKGILAMATGTGKSKIPIDYIKSRKKSIKSVALIVPTEQLRDNNWKEEFKKWDCEDLWDKVEPLCYASAHKINKKSYDLVILDECHNITELNSLFFSNNKIKDIIGLTATLPKEDKVLILDSLGLKVTYTLTLDDAVSLGIVSPYKITVIKTKLDCVNKTVLAGSKTNPFYTTECKAYEFHEQRVAKSYGKSKQMAVLSRMRFIYNLKTKTDAAQFVIENLIPKDKRTIIFAGSIDQAEKLCKHSFHSKNKKKNHLQDFIDGIIDSLSCVEAVNEGVNIPRVDYGIAVQLNSNSKDIIQRLGRLIRLFKGHSAHLYIFCAADTVDETWVNSALSVFDPENIEFIDFQTLKEEL